MATPAGTADRKRKFTLPWLKTPQERVLRDEERVLRDEEAEAVPAESVHLKRKATGYLEDYVKKDYPKKSALLTSWIAL